MDFLLSKLRTVYFLLDARQTPITTNYKRTCALGYNLSTCDVCGLNDQEPNVRIVGGVDALQKSWPSVGALTSIYFSFGTKYSLYCSLTLIERRTALTAAHCKVKGVSLSSYRVLLGLYALSELTNGLSSYVQSIALSKFVTVI